MLPLFAAGALSILVQTVLLRELMAAAHGTEVTLGFGLAAWLLGGAAGSALAARMPGRMAGNRGLAVCFAAAGVLALPGLALIRGFKSMAGYLPGQGISLGHMALLSLAVMSAAGLALGAMYVFGVRFLEGRGQRFSAGAAYWTEAAGCLAGGAAFTFLLAFKLGSAGAMMMAAGLAAFGAAWTSGRHAARLLGIAAAAGSIAAATALGRTIDTGTLAWQNPGSRVVASASSPYGRTVTTERQGQRDVFHNGYPVFHAPGRTSLPGEELAAWGLLHAGRAESVLLIGGAEMLPLFLRLGCRTVYAEPDPALLRAIAEAGRWDPESPFGSPGLRLANNDGRAHLERSREKYDLVVLALPPPAAVSQNRYYTREFFTAAGRALKPGGAIVIGLPGSQAALDGCKARLMGSVLSAMASSLPQVEVFPGETFYLTGLKKAETVPESSLLRRFGVLGGAFGVFSAGHLRHRLEEKRLKGGRAEAGLRDFGPNRDFSPRALVPGMMLWQRAFSPGWARAYQSLTRHSYWLWLILAAGFLWPRMRHGGAAFTAGAASMGLQALCLWGIQISSGALYQWLGLGNALFMAGTAAGAWICTTRPRARSIGMPRWETGFFLWALAFLAGQAFLKMPGWAYLICSAVTGAMLGLEFPALVSGRAGEKNEPESAAAGPVYAWDMAGGVFSALAAGVVLIPAWGMVPTAAFMAGLKALSLRWWIRG